MPAAFQSSPLVERPWALTVAVKAPETVTWAMTALSVSGAAIYSLRIARERGDRVAIRRGFRGMWQGMGRWRALSVALIGIGFILTAFLILGIQ